VFHSSAKTEMGFGYPTFTEAIPEHTTENLIMMGMIRCEHGFGGDCAKECMVLQKPGMVFEEVTDVRAGAHLGWSFFMNGKRCYIVNAAGLHFIPDGQEIPTRCWACVNPGSGCPKACGGHRGGGGNALLHPWDPNKYL